MSELEHYIKEIGQTPKQKADELIKKLSSVDFAIVVYDNVFDELIPYSVEMQYWQEVKNELDKLTLIL